MSTDILKSPIVDRNHPHFIRLISVRILKSATEQKDSFKYVFEWTLASVLNVCWLLNLRTQCRLVATTPGLLRRNKHIGLASGSGETDGGRNQLPTTSRQATVSGRVSEGYLAISQSCMSAYLLVLDIVGHLSWQTGDRQQMFMLLEVKHQWMPVFSVYSPNKVQIALSAPGQAGSWGVSGHGGEKC